MSFNLLYCKDMVKPYYKKVFRESKKSSVRICFTKQLFLKVLQNSQENTYVGVTF